jgi:hypothetical protein
MAKIRTDDRYAQNLYAAMCNIRWQPRDVIPILKDEYWSCSWRAAGREVADLRARGEDYMDYYCSGIRGGTSYDLVNDDKYFERTGFVSEGEVTEEIEQDLLSIGWQWSEWPVNESTL